MQVSHVKDAATRPLFCAEGSDPDGENDDAATVAFAVVVWIRRWRRSTCRHALSLAAVSTFVVHFSSAVLTGGRCSFSIDDSYVMICPRREICAKYCTVLIVNSRPTVGNGGVS